MNHAQFMNRGEQFFVIQDSTRYEGECVWSREEVAGGGSQPAYPVKIFVTSIRRAGVTGSDQLTQPHRFEIAQLAKKLLESTGQGCSIELLDDH